MWFVDQRSWPVAAIEPPAVEIKLFGRWNPDEVQVSDISLQVSVILGRVSLLSKMMRHDCPNDEGLCYACTITMK